MLKLTLILISSIISYLVWQRRQTQARTRLVEIDEGRRCIACNRTNLEQAAGVARCLSCGYTVALENLQAAVVTASEIASVTKRHDRPL